MCVGARSWLGAANDLGYKVLTSDPADFDYEVPAPSGQPPGPVPQGQSPRVAASGNDFDYELLTSSDWGDLHGLPWPFLGCAASASDFGYKVLLFYPP